MTRWCSSSLRCSSFCTSPSSSFVTGMCVQRLTTLAMSSSSTSSLMSRAPPCVAAKLASPALELAFQFGELAVLEFGRLAQVVLRARPARSRAWSARSARAPSLQLAAPPVFSVCHCGLERVGLGLESASSFFSLSSRSRGGGVLFLLQRLAFDLQLHDAGAASHPARPAWIDLGAQLGRGLVDQVDGLVRQKTVGDVAIRHDRGGHQGGILDAHAVMHLVSFSSGRAGSKSCPRRSADRPSPAGSGVPGRRPSRCACGIRRAWWRRCNAARRGPASA